MPAATESATLGIIDDGEDTIILNGRRAMAAMKKKAGSKKISTAIPDPNQIIYRRRHHEPNFSKIPWCLYFYYIGVDGSGSRLVRHYFYDSPTGEIKPHEVAPILRNLALNAREPERMQVPPPDGANLHFIVWRRRSYVAFLIDTDYREFFLPRAALTFDDQLGLENHSFFDGWDLEVDVSSPTDPRRRASAICFVNHMTRDQGGAVLDSSAQYFSYWLHTNLIPLYPDSGGTNMGPPLGPP